MCGVCTDERMNESVYMGPPEVGPPERPEVEEAKAKIAKALEGVPPHKRQQAIKLLMKKYEGELRDQELHKAELELRVAAAYEVIAWSDSKPALVLERNDCSRLHKLKEAARRKRVVECKGESIDVQSVTYLQHTFVLKHDWAGAFAKAEGIEDEIKLPYEICAFEFRIGGKTIIALAHEDAGPHFTMFVEAGDFWYSFDALAEADESKLVDFIWSQIRAICIALDAEVATHTVVRASAKLNEKRVRSGKIPLLDYSIVDLSRRHRVTNPAGATGGGGRKRLHFRRGHWRHYETTKTWIRWCLVGDPDLGFISKHYSL